MCKTTSPEFTTYWDFPILIVRRPTGLTKELAFLEACASALAMYREALTQASDLGVQFTGGSGERTVQLNGCVGTQAWVSSTRIGPSTLCTVLTGRAFPKEARSST